MFFSDCCVSPYCVYQFSPGFDHLSGGSHYASQALVTIWGSNQICMEGRRFDLSFIVVKHGGDYCTVRVLGEPDNKRCCGKGIDFYYGRQHRSVPRRYHYNKKCVKCGLKLVYLVQFGHVSVQAAFADKGLFECLVQGKQIALLLVNVYVTASLINF